MKILAIGSRVLYGRVPTPLPILLTKLAPMCSPAAKAVTRTSSWRWHERVYSFANRVGSSVDGKIGNVARVTGDDRFASEVDVNLGSNFVPNWLFNVASRADSNVASMPAQRIGLGVVVRIDTTAWSKDRIESCCWDWHQRQIKDSGRALLRGDSPKLMSAARIDSKIGAGVGSRRGTPAEVSWLNNSQQVG